MKFFTLVMLFVSVTYSQTATIRSTEDVKNYENFLRNSIHGKPQASVTPKLKELQPEWERSGKFEGDILLTEDQIDMLVDEYAEKRNALTVQSKLWPNNVILYDINRTDFTSDQIKAIENGIANIANVSCLTFKPKTSSDNNYISVQGNPGGCFSTVGYAANGAQNLNLRPSTPGSGCFHHGTIVHEFLHSLGFYHMQSTYNRDDYVKIVWQSIQPGKEHNFNKYTSSQVTLLNTEYDYGSVLHYSEYGFSTDGNKTIVPLKTTTETIGQRIGMSKSDIIKLNRLYKCPEKNP